MTFTEFYICLAVLAAIMLIVYIVVKQPVVKGIFYALFVFVVSFECLFIIPQLALFVAIALVAFQVVKNACVKNKKVSSDRTKHKKELKEKELKDEKSE